MKWTLPGLGKRNDEEEGRSGSKSEREVVVSDEFLSCLDAMEPEMRERTVEKIRLLASNPNHPSLNAHKLKRAPDKWECYVTDRHRLIYDSSRKELRLWKVGDHSIVDHVHHMSFAPHTPFRRLEAPEQASPVARTPFEIPPEWLQHKGDSDSNPFALVPASHLRILGVPAHLVTAVRVAPSADEATQLPGLSEHTRDWLLELLTNPNLSEVLYDPGRLLFRTTLDKLEGYCQGRLKRLMLNLEDEQRQHVDRGLDGAHLLRGCAGSGKTTVALYRAIRCAESGEKTIFLTYTRTLANAARTLIEELIGKLPDNLEVDNIDHWMNALLRSRGVKEIVPPVLSISEQQHMIDDAIDRIPPEKRARTRTLQSSFVVEEISRVIKSNGLQSEGEYLEFRRHGRETALRAAARAVVWAIYEDYQAQLRALGRMDWQEIPLRTIAELRSCPLQSPYQHVVIDEAQDLTAMHIRVARQMMGTDSSSPAEGKTIFLVGDVSQTLYTRGFSWRQAGLQLLGRSASLKRNFRNTRQIAEAAAALNANNQILKASEDYVDPEATQRQGPKPIVLRCDVVDREFRAVGEKMLDLAGGNGFRISDFAVVCPTNRLCDEAARRLQAMDLPSVKHKDGDFDILAESVKVLTIHSAKGLEFPVVFVVGLHEGLLPRLATSLDEDEVAEHLEQQRTIMYVAMTRAAEALYLVTSGNEPSRFIGEVREQVREETFTGGK